MSKKQIRYLNRDFDTILKKLVDYTKYYYPESFNDFSPSSPSMVILQLIAYVGDVLNFYIDKQTKQSILYYAQEKQSIYNIAQSYGYKIKKAIPGSVQLIIRIPVPIIDNQLDYTNIPIILPGAIVSPQNNPSQSFTILQQINLKQDGEILPVYMGNSASDQYKIIQKKVIAYSLIQKNVNIPISSNINNNTKLYLPDQNIVKILDVKDGEGNYWYEVSNLSDNQIITVNQKIVNKINTRKRFRFLTDTNNRQYLYFGSKQIIDESNNEHWLNINNNYSQIPVGAQGQQHYLTIRYLVANQSQVQSREVNNIIFDAIGFENKHLTQQMIVFNQKPSIGGQGVESLQSIKQNAIALINTQNRLVTPQDYKKMISLMPAQYGEIAKSYVRLNKDNNKIQIYVLGKNKQGHLVDIPQQIKKNLGQYLQKYRIIGSSYQIKSAFIINVKCRFNIAVHKTYSKQQILYQVIQKIKNYMNIDNFEIGSYIDTNQIRNIILNTTGVTNIIGDIYFYNQIEDGYSVIEYNMNNALKEGKYYTDIRPSIFEMKFPNLDIQGRAL